MTFHQAEIKFSEGENVFRPLEGYGIKNLDDDLKKMLKILISRLAKSWTLSQRRSVGEQLISNKN